MASRVTGTGHARALSARLASADKVLDEENVKALQRAAPKIARSIDRSAAKRLPARGGYAATVVASLRFDVKINRKGMHMTMHARGLKDNRDLPALDRGTLRHPVYGRYRKTKKGVMENPWVAQRIRPRTFSDPMDHEAPRILERELRQGLENTARYIEGK